MLNNRDDIKGHRSHVKQHAGDINKGSEQENALPTKKNGQEKPGEAMGQVGPTRWPDRSEPAARLASAVAVARRAEGGCRRRWGCVAATGQPIDAHLISVFSFSVFLGFNLSVFWQHN